MAWSCRLPSVTTHAPGSNPFGTETTLTGTTHCANNATLTNDDAYGLTTGLGQGGIGWMAWTASCGGGSDAPVVHLRRATAGGFEGPITVVKPTGESGVLQGYPLESLSAGLCIVLVVVAVNLLGERMAQRNDDLEGR